MDIFNKITVSNFIWYLVPGLGLIFFLLFPLVVFKPNVVKLVFDTIGSIGLIILGSMLGFLLDGLRLYRFRPEYLEIKKTFFQKLQETIGPYDPYLIQSYIYDVARGKNVTGFSLHHAIWIMLGHFTILGLLEGFFWLLIALCFTYMKFSAYQLFGASVSKEVFILSCVVFGLLFVFIGFRLQYVSIQVQRTTNNMFSHFAERYKADIKKLLNVTPTD